jgi:hypothetical protein
VVAGPSGREYVLAHQRSVQIQLVDSQGRRVQPRPADPSLDGELAPEVRRRLVAGGILVPVRLDEVCAPVAALEQSGLDRATGAPVAPLPVHATGSNLHLHAIAGAKRRERPRNENGLGRLDMGNLVSAPDLVRLLVPARLLGEDSPRQPGRSNAERERRGEVLGPDVRDRLSGLRGLSQGAPRSRSRTGGAPPVGHAS